MAMYSVEHNKNGYWSPIFVCELRPNRFSKFLRWLKQECDNGAFNVPFATVRVKRERDNVTPAWMFDGSNGYPIR